jgi:hypothetical protein
LFEVLCSTPRVFSITFGHEQWYILYYYYGKKKSAGLHFWACGEHASGYHVTSDHVTSCDKVGKNVAVLDIFFMVYL